MIRQIRYFQSVVRNNSFSEAAEYFYQKSLVLIADYERMCREAGKLAKGDKDALVIGYLRCYSGQGFMPVEGVKRAENFGSSISRIPLFRGDSQITRNYCAFWKQENSGYYVEEFADILKRKFE